MKLSPTERFNKSDAGRQEIRDRLHPLSRSARNLLLIMDGTRPALEWLSLVQGATVDDLADLLQARLVEPLDSGEAVARAPAAASVPPLPAAAAATPAGGLDAQGLYAALNSMVRDQLGLVKGFKFSLEIERANGRAELEALAWRFVDEVQQAKGDAAARQVRRALKLPPG